eukprot:m51a1_g1921 hypothetical protein (363) ;mRNA; f:855518-856786
MESDASTEQPTAKKARISPEVLPRIADSERAVSSTDGINWSSYLTRRRETCDELLELIRHGGAILVRAPPMSGKTSLLQLFVEHLCKTLSHDALIVHTDLLSLPATAGTNDDAVMRRIEQASDGRITVEDFRGNSKRRTVLLVDAAHIAYESKGTRFWEYMKNMSMVRPTRFSVVLFSAYGDRAVSKFGEPFEFAIENTRDSSFMALRQSELVEIVTDFNRICSQTPSKAGISVSVPVRQTIAQLTGRHAGLVYRVLSQISDKFNNRIEPVPDKEIVSFLHGAEMLAAVQSCHAVPVLEGNESALLCSILVSPKRMVTEFQWQPYHKLVKKGVVYVSRDAVLKFGSPFIEIAYMRQLSITPS